MSELKVLSAKLQALAIQFKNLCIKKQPMLIEAAPVPTTAPAPDAAPSPKLEALFNGLLPLLEAVKGVEDAKEMRKFYSMANAAKLSRLRAITAADLADYKAEYEAEQKSKSIEKDDPCRKEFKAVYKLAQKSEKALKARDLFIQRGDGIQLLANEYTTFALAKSAAPNHLNKIGEGNSDEGIWVFDNSLEAPLKQLETLAQAFETLKSQQSAFVQKQFAKPAHNLKPFLKAAQECRQRTAKNLEDPSIEPERLQGDGQIASQRSINNKPLYENPKNVPNEDVVHPNDVQQGAIGDCYLLAALQAVAKRRPEVIKNAITDNGNATYTVELYLRQPNSAQRVCQKITISNKFVGNYAASLDRGELWVRVIEKAMAKLLGGYDDLKSGSTDWVLEMLTGQTVTTHEISKTTVPATLAATIQQAFAAGKLITLGIKSNANIPTSPRYIMAEISNNVSVSHSITFNGQTIFCSHAYSVDSVQVVGGKTEFTLQNPHGASNPAPNSAYPVVDEQFIVDCSNGVNIL